MAPFVIFCMDPQQEWMGCFGKGLTGIRGMVRERGIEFAAPFSPSSPFDPFSSPLSPQPLTSPSSTFLTCSSPSFNSSDQFQVPSLANHSLIPPSQPLFSFREYLGPCNLIKWYPCDSFVELATISFPFTGGEWSLEQCIAKTPQQKLCSWLAIRLEYQSDPRVPPTRLFFPDLTQFLVNGALNCSLQKRQKACRTTAQTLGKDSYLLQFAVSLLAEFEGPLRRLGWFWRLVLSRFEALLSYIHIAVWLTFFSFYSLWDM